MKKILLAFWALATATVVTASASAENITTLSNDFNEEVETINICGYECYEIDGNYWTIDNGDLCLVVNLDDFKECDANNNVAPTSLNDTSKDPTGDWQNPRFVECPHGYEREDTADISKGNYDSPIFRVYPITGDNSYNVQYRLNCKVNKNVKMTIYAYHPNGDMWTESDDVTRFPNHYYLIFTGSTLKTTRAIAIRFYKEGSDSSLSSFNYSFQAKLPLL